MSQCPAAHYNNNGTCTACTANCASCDATGCLACSTPFNLFGSVCVPTCPASTFTLNHKCESCDASCASCSGPTTSECVSCDQTDKSHAVFFNNSCVMNCPSEGYTEDLGAKRCVACDSSCLTCSDAQNTKKCDSCPSPMNLFNATCVANCPSGFYSANGAC